MKLHLNINSFVISQDVFENVRSLMPNLTKISGVFGLSFYVVVFFDQINYSKYIQNSKKYDMSYIQDYENSNATSFTKIGKFGRP